MSIFEILLFPSYVWTMSNFISFSTNLPKQLMEYPDFAFPEEKKSFVSHRDVLAYLDDYAGEFGLKQKLLLNTNVDSVQALNQSQAGGDTKWKVFSTTNDSEDQLELDFDSVMVCNGYKVLLPLASCQYDVAYC